MTPASSPNRPTYRLSRLGVLRGRYLFRPHRVRYSRNLTKEDALGIAMPYGAGGTLTVAAALATCLPAEPGMTGVFYNGGQTNAVAPGSIAALQKYLPS